MDQLYDYWMHGVNIQIEYTDEARNLDVCRKGWGIEIKQNKETFNWLHIAIPTPVTSNDDNINVKLNKVYLKCKLKNDVKITTVHIWCGDSRVYGGKDFVFDETTEIQIIPSLLFKDQNEILVEEPVNICLKVEFGKNEGGLVTLAGAGARFNVT